MRIVHEGTAAASVTLYDFEPTTDRICDDVVRGLTRDPRKLPPKYFYDERGARLFERITELDAYYPTRTEVAILRLHATEIAERIGPRVRLVEFGSGSGDKTWILLRHLKDPAAYVPIDISRTQLVGFALSVAEAFPHLTVTPVCADYTAEYHLPADDGGAERCVAFFPGSTMGNFEPHDAEEFLRHARERLGSNGGLLIGVDLRKDVEVIERAYNDPEGVTAEFNLNLLARINRECGADFDVDAFRHHAFFDDAHSRVEMRLVSERPQIVHLVADPEGGAEVDVSFGAGDYVTTEYSHKYDLRAFASLAARTGWEVTASWTDDRNWFAVILLS